MAAFFNDMSVLAKFLLTFIVVLAVLGAAGYLMRRFSGGNVVTAGPRGRQPRLAVIDAASVDGRRRLVLVRRDNIEHLLLIGGPTDIVVEPNIGKPVPAATAPAPVRDAKPSPALEPLPPAWPPGEPYVEPPRTARESVFRPPPVPGERQRLGSFIEDGGAPPLLPMSLPEPEPAFQPPPPHPPAPPSFEPVFQVAPAPEPKRMPAAPPLPPRPAQSEESNLAEMAQRLEAALRRPIKPVEPPAPPASRFSSEPPPLAMPPRSPPPPPPEFAPPAFPPPAPPATAHEPVPPPLPREPLPKEPMPELTAVPADIGARPTPVFTSIEEEMASLLGRSPGKS
jgi:flagellar protein FliO/FliZ